MSIKNIVLEVLTFIVLAGILLTCFNFLPEKPAEKPEKQLYALVVALFSTGLNTYLFAIIFWLTPARQLYKFAICLSIFSATIVSLLLLFGVI